MYSTKKIAAVLKNVLRIKSVNNIKVKNKKIKQIFIENELIGKITVRCLSANDSLKLFSFYFNGLSGKSRKFFPPYPLFSPPLNSPKELTKRIISWQKENDWMVLVMIRNSQIIGIGLLKRWSTAKPTIGLAIKEEFQRKGLGSFLLETISEQACLLGLKKIYATMARGNIASMRLHEKCGFVKTGKTIPHISYKSGNKIIDRHDIEMVKKIN